MVVRSKAVKAGYVFFLGALCLVAFPLSASALDKLSFQKYPSVRPYKGKAAQPDFLHKDKDFANFKTRILSGMKNGVTFAGEFSVIQFGCGTGCSNVIVANNRTGRLFSFPRGGETNQALTLKFQPNSKLMLARWYTDSLWETCMMETFVFDNGNWLTINSNPSKEAQICDAFIPEH